MAPKKPADVADTTETQEAAAPSAAEKNAAAAASEKAKHPRIKVRATQDGYYDDVLRRAGDVFTIDGTPRKAVEQHAEAVKEKKANAPADFSPKWMEPVDPDTPERTTSHNEVLRQQHDEEVAARLERGKTTGPATGDLNVIE